MMKKIITGMIVLAALSFTASAQTQGDDVSRADRGERRQNSNRINPRMLEQLDLSAAQKDQLKLINEDFRSKMQEMIKSDIPAEDRKSKRNTLEAERTAKVLAVLTPAQTKKLKELQATQNMGQNGEYKEKTKIDGEKTKVKVKND